MKQNAGKNKTAASIPPPPEPGKDYDALIAYHSKYSVEELLKAGHLEEAPPEESRGVRAAAMYQLLLMRGLQIKMSKRAYRLLAEKAARHDATVEDLVKRWIKERLTEPHTTAPNGRFRKRKLAAK